MTIVMRNRMLTLLGAVLALGACTSPQPRNLASGADAYATIPAAPETPEPATVRALQPGDVIAVDVFREPDFSAAKVPVDEVGDIQLPVVGQVAAAGSSPAELARRIETRLGQRYIRNPRVTVAVVTAVPRTVTVEGQVRSPGVIAVARNQTLLRTLAQAGSPTDLAKLNEVVVFRTVDGRRMGAVFDARKIRVGEAPDPQILDGDIVVVGFNQIRGAFRDFLSITPLIGLFQVF